ncbi:alpha/beta hydrolase [Amycolatopsis acidicola]|nr:alpha/beta hydrolase [Amycolatopsis acidicola]
MNELIDRFRAVRDAPAGQEPPPLEEIRAAFAPAGRIHPVPEDVRVEEVDAGGVPAHWLTAPGVDAGKVLVYVHGGGFMVGSLRSHAELAARLGRAAGARVLLPEYRLAPEHPFPAAPEDVRTVWQWVRAQGVPASSIVLAGDSAGGNLVLGLLIALRDAGEELPAAAALLSPGTDCTGESFTDTDDPIFTVERLRALVAPYVGDADPRDPLVSPLYADLTGLPQLLVQVGTAELLLANSELFAEAATAAGVDVTLHVEEGAPHVYPIMLGTPEAEAATAQAAEFFRAAVG